MAWTDYDAPGDMITGIICAKTGDGSNPLVQTDALSTIGVDTTFLSTYVDATHGFLIVPVASLVGLVDSEADESTGDARKVVRAFIEQFYTWYNAIPTSSRPGQLTITQSGLVDTGTSGEARRTWSVQTDLNTSGLEVADE